MSGDRSKQAMAFALADLSGAVAAAARDVGAITGPSLHEDEAEFARLLSAVLNQIEAFKDRWLEPEGSVH